MNRADIINVVSESLSEQGFTKKDVEKVIDLFFEEVEKGLIKGEEIKISSFGTFKVKTRKPRIGTSPVTKEKIQIPPSKNVGFKASKILKSHVK